MFLAGMTFDLGEEVASLRDMVHRWAQERVKPMAAEVCALRACPSLTRPNPSRGTAGDAADLIRGGERDGAARACFNQYWDGGGAGGRRTASAGLIPSCPAPSRANARNPGRANHPLSASAARIRAQLRMPLWKLDSSYFSLGEWI